ncbi:MAG: hypothetical protein K6F87_00850 [Lachnospiraceae bacterium]|nr:hypothetical protein [Lachnospiraceae bacterium]
MDGFRERLSGRYDRSGMRSGGYDRSSSDDRYESDRYERAPRRGSGDSISQEAINEAINEAVTKANREQLDVIADFFDEAKADRMESERAIIDAFSHSLNEAVANGAAKTAEPVAEAVHESQPVTPIVVDEQNSETLSRIERIAGQNAEVINESSEMLERSVESLRSNAEALNEIKSSISELKASSDEVKESSAQIQSSIRQSLQELSNRVTTPVPMQDLTVDFTSEKDEIIGAVGDNRAILNMIRQDVLNGFAKSAEAEENEEDKIVPLSAEEAGNYYKELEEHIHKEAVKCYRNVQSALTEQGAEANKGLEKSVSGMRIMVLLAFLFSLASFLIQILNMFGILPV